MRRGGGESRTAPRLARGGAADAGWGTEPTARRCGPPLEGALRAVAVETADAALRGEDLRHWRAPFPGGHGQSAGCGRRRGAVGSCPGLDCGGAGVRGGRARGRRRRCPCRRRQRAGRGLLARGVRGARVAALGALRAVAGRGPRASAVSGVFVDVRDRGPGEHAAGGRPPGSAGSGRRGGRVPSAGAGALVLAGRRVREGGRRGPVPGAAGRPGRRSSLAAPEGWRPPRG